MVPFESTSSARVIHPKSIIEDVTLPERIEFVLVAQLEGNFEEIALFDPKNEYLRNYN